MTHTEAVLDRLRTEEQLATNAGDKPILARSFRLAIQEIERLCAALDIARSALLRIEQGSESARASITRTAEALISGEDR